MSLAAKWSGANLDDIIFFDVATGVSIFTMRDGTDGVIIHDGIPLSFGNDVDVAAKWVHASSILQILPVLNDTGAIHLGNGTKDIDLKVFLGGATKYVLFDVGSVLLTLEDVDLKLGDNDILQFGDAAGGDVAIKFDGSDFSTIPAAASQAWLIGADSKLINITLKGALTVGKNDTGHDVKFFGATDGAFVLWDQANDKLIFDKAHIQLGDSDEFRFGDLAAGDIVVKFDGSDFSVVPAAASEDFLIGADATLLNITLKGTLTVGKDGVGHNVTFYSATASSYMLWDEANDKLVFEGADLQLNDSDELRFGDLAAGDIVFTFNGTNFLTTPAAASQAWLIGADSNLMDITLKGTLTVGEDGVGHNVTFYSATASSYMFWDEANDKLVFEGADLQLNDADELRFGDLAAGDVVFAFGGTDFTVLPAAASQSFLLGGDSNLLNITLKGTLTVGEDNTGHDVKFFGATAGAYLLWDEDINALVTAGVARLTLNGVASTGVTDGSVIKMGTSGSPLVDDQAGAGFIVGYFDCGATSGWPGGLYISTDLTGVGGSFTALQGDAVIKAAKATVTGIESFMQLVSPGKVTGAARACQATIDFGNYEITTGGGTYAAACFNVKGEGSSCDPSLAQRISCLELKTEGTFKTDKNFEKKAAGYAIYFNGFSPAAGTTNILTSTTLTIGVGDPANVIGIRVGIGGDADAGEAYYIPLIPASEWD